VKRLLQRYELAGLTLFDSLYPAGLKQPRHAHASASFSFVLAGNYLENYGRQTHLRQPSTVILHPPQESHSVDFQSEVRIVSVHFDNKRLAYIRDHVDVLDSCTHLRTETICWLGHRMHKELCRKDTLSTLAIEGLVFEILAEAFRAKDISERNAPHWLDQVEEFLHEHFSESFGFDEVARVAGVHPVHLARVFRKKYGCTIGEYLRRLRVEFARRQMSTTRRPLGEIALAAGFADQSHFTKAFKAHFGLKPSDYRRFFCKG